MSDKVVNTYSTGNKGLGTYSSLAQRQVYSKNASAGGQNPYRDDNNWASKNPYANNRGAYAGVEKGSSFEGKKYKRFNDLKLLNEQMMNLSNNMQPDESPLEVLSQGQKGEIKNLLGRRVFKLSILPALAAFLLTTTAILSNSLVFVILAFFMYVFVMGRIFFYPAKLYYENIQCKTTRHAKLFFEEMDFWFKLGVVNTYIYFSIVAIFTFLTIFFEDYILSIFKSIANKSSGSVNEGIISYVNNMSFAMSLFILFLIYILTIFLYIKFVKKEKLINEEKLKKKLKDIRNQTMSRVEQIQSDKDEI